MGQHQPLATFYLERSRQTPSNGPRTVLPRADRAGCGALHASHGPAAGPGASVPPLSPGRCGLYKACKTTPARSPLGRAGGRAACQAFPAPGSAQAPARRPDGAARSGRTPPTPPRRDGARLHRGSPACTGWAALLIAGKPHPDPQEASGPLPIPPRRPSRGGGRRLCPTRA